jgi:hypothetical protein
VDIAGEPFLHVIAEPFIGCQFRRLGSPGSELGFPLSNPSPIVRLAAASGCVAAQFTRDCRWRPTDLPCNLPDASPRLEQHSDLLAFSERQIAVRQWVQFDGRHAATLAEPAAADWPRGAASHRSGPARQSLGNLDPERTLDIATSRRSTR